jgi:hypothetical protein
MKNTLKWKIHTDLDNGDEATTVFPAGQNKSKKEEEHNTSDSQVVSYPSTKKA